MSLGISYKVKRENDKIVLYKEIPFNTIKVKEFESEDELEAYLCENYIYLPP